MHESHVHDFYSRYLNEIELIIHSKTDASGLPSTSRYHYETAIAYLAGFICHYTLDYVSHPYIYGRTNYRIDDPDQLYYYARHRSLETRLDTFMLRHIKHLEPSQFKRIKALPKNRFESGFLSLMLCRCINDVFYLDTSRSIYKKVGMTRSKRYIDRLYYRDTRKNRVSPKTMQNIFNSVRLECRILDDRTGVKKELVKSIENKTVKYDLLSSLMSADSIEDTMDDLNLSHIPWRSPWEPDTDHTDSFPELFCRAVKQCNESLSLLEQYNICLEEDHFNAPLAKSILLDQLGNRSYHSGFDCNTV